MNAHPDSENNGEGFEGKLKRAGQILFVAHGNRMRELYGFQDAFLRMFPNGDPDGLQDAAFRNELEWPASGELGITLATIKDTDEDWAAFFRRQPGWMQLSGEDAIDLN